MSTVEPKPDLADVPMKPSPPPGRDDRAEPDRPAPPTPPAEDLTLPTE